MCDVPEVSVVIPVHRAQYIAQALSSVFAQTFTRYEIIVVNDGSPETEQIENEVRPYQQGVIYLKQANAGPSAARNTGIRRSRAPILLFWIATTPGIQIIWRNSSLRFALTPGSIWSIAMPS